MKTQFSILVLSLLTFSSASAQKVSSGVNFTHAGRSISATYGKVFNKSEVGIGLGLNINQYKMPDNQNNIFYKRLYATEPLHFLALKTYYHKSININRENIAPFAFYDLQLRYAKTRNENLNYENRSWDPFDFFGPFTWLEQTIGLGIDIQLSNRIFYRQKLGIGTSFILGKETAYKDSCFVWEFGALYSFEVGYLF